MKKNFKIYKALLLCAVVLFIGCSKDDYNIQQSQKDTYNVLRDRILTGSEALSIKDKLNAQLGNTGLNKGESSYGTIDYTEIRNVLDMSGKDNYTFRVLNHPESSDKVFFNLVMIQRESYTTVMLVKYEMDAAFADAYYNKTKDFVQFNGTVSFSLVSSNDPCPPVPPKPVTPNPIPGGGGGQGDSPDTSPDQGSGSDSGLWQMYMTMYYAEHAGDSANNWTGNSNDTGSSSGGGIIPPRFFRMALSTNNPTKDPCDKGNTIGVLDPQVYAQFNAFIASLSDDQQSWLYNNSTTAGLLLDYLNDYGFSDESKQIATELITVLANNGDDPNVSEDGIVLDAPPSCQSFNFTPTTSNWQESAVENIHFIIVLLDHNGLNINHVVDFPNAILFGMPMNIQIGNTNVTSGVAATVSANVLARSVRETVKMYGGKPVSETIVSLYFESRLKHNYQTSIPGGRVNTHPTSYSVTPTQYKSTTSGSDSCM